MKDMKESKYMKESNINTETESLNNFITIFHCLLIENVQFLNCFELDWIGLDAATVVTCFILLNQTQSHH
jgi:hypothetical protein